jgi:hypothetical protein
MVFFFYFFFRTLGVMTCHSDIRMTWHETELKTRDCKLRLTYVIQKFVGGAREPPL